MTVVYLSFKSANLVQFTYDEFPPAAMTWKQKYVHHQKHAISTQRGLDVVKRVINGNK